MDAIRTKQTVFVFNSISMTYCARRRHHDNSPCPVTSYLQLPVSSADTSPLQQSCEPQTTPEHREQSEHAGFLLVSRIGSDLNKLVSKLDITSFHEGAHNRFQTPRDGPPTSSRNRTTISLPKLLSRRNPTVVRRSRLFANGFTRSVMDGRIRSTILRSLLSPHPENSTSDRDEPTVIFCKRQGAVL
ncbi:hypothetical protein BD309DRAFT_440323 [Dichomitus squalens]|nr:hypothetical protein BD309DRAFT_440323 [Dichomitus squalens]